MIAVIALVCVLVAGVVVRGEARQYSASADLLISPVSSGDDDFVGVQVLHDSDVAPSSDVLTLARLIKTPETAAIVAARPGMNASATSLLDKITVSPLSQTSMVEITATGTTPVQAADIANGFAHATIQRRTTVFQAALRPIVSRLQGEANKLAKSATGDAALPAIEGRLAVLQPLLGAPDPTLDLLDSAEPPTSPASRHTMITLVAALIGGLLIGVVVALLRELTDRRVRRERELDGVFDAPILARVPVDTDRSGIATATAFRDLRTRLFDREGAPETVVFTEARDGDGATAAVLHLARSLAASGKRVVILDCDFVQPAVAAAFGVKAPQAGFDAIFGNGDLKRGLVAVPGESGRLHLALPSLQSGRGRRLADLDPTGVREALRRLHAVADVVVVDTSPLARGTDALLVADAVGAAVVAVRLGSTSKPGLERLASMLDEFGVIAAGVVLFNGAVSRRRLRSAVHRARQSVRPVRQPPSPGGRAGHGDTAGTRSNRRRVESNAARTR